MWLGSHGSGCSCTCNRGRLCADVLSNHWLILGLQIILIPLQHVKYRYLYVAHPTYMFHSITSILLLNTDSAAVTPLSLAALEALALQKFDWLTSIYGGWNRPILKPSNLRIEKIKFQDLLITWRLVRNGETLLFKYYVCFLCIRLTGAALNGL